MLKIPLHLLLLDLLLLRNCIVVQATGPQEYIGQEEGDHNYYSNKNFVVYGNIDTSRQKLKHGVNTLQDDSTKDNLIYASSFLGIEMGSEYDVNGLKEIKRKKRYINSFDARGSTIIIHAGDRVLDLNPGVLPPDLAEVPKIEMPISILPSELEGEEIGLMDDEAAEVVDDNADTDIEPIADEAVEVADEAVEVADEAVEVADEAVEDADLEADVIIEEEIVPEEDIDADAHTDADAGGEAEVEVEVEVEAEVEVEPTVDAESDVNADAEVDIESEVDADSEGDAQPDEEADEEIEIDVIDATPYVGLVAETDISVDDSTDIDSGDIDEAIVEDDDHGDADESVLEIAADEIHENENTAPPLSIEKSIESAFMDKMAGLHMNMQDMVTILKLISERVGCPHTTDAEIISSVNDDSNGYLRDKYMAAVKDFETQNNFASISNNQNGKEETFSDKMNGLKMNMDDIVTILKDIAGKVGCPHQQATEKQNVSVAQCPASFTQVDSSTCLYVDMEKTLSWRAARFACNKMGAQLVYPLEYEQPMDFLVRLKKQIDMPMDPVWVGGSDRNQEGVWHWLDGRPTSKNLPWRPGHPQNFNGREDCMALSFMEPMGLKASKCIRRKHYVCQKNL